MCTLLCGLSMLAASQDLEALSRQAREAMAAGRYPEAVALYERMVKALPAEPGVKLNLALALDAAGRPREALRNLEPIQAAEAGNARFWFLLGIEYQKLQQPSKAVAPLERAVKLDPKETAYRVELADAYLASGALWQAASAFRALAAEQPRDPRFLAGIVRAELAMSGDAYEALVHTAPESSFRFALEALSEMDKGNRDRAAELQRRAGSARPDIVAGDLLAQQFHRGDFESIVSQTSTVRTPEALYWRARACSELARTALARLAALPPSPEAYELAGVALRQSARWEDSIAEFQEAVKLAPDNLRLRSELAKAYWLSRRYEEAAKLLAQLIVSGPDRGDWEFQLGDSLFNLGRPEQSLPHLRKAAALSPGDFTTQAMLGRVLLQTGHAQEAALALEKAAPRDADGSIHFQLAAAYRSLGRPELARRATVRQKEIEQKRSAQAPVDGK